MSNAPVIPWVPITLAMLERYAPASLIDALKTADTDAADDRLPGVIATVTVEIRNAVASRRANRVDLDPTLIPVDLEACAAWLVIDRLQNVAGMGLTDSQKESLIRETAKLRDVMSGKLVVSLPANPATPLIEPLPAAQLVRSEGRRERRFSREDQRGL